MGAKDHRESAEYAGPVRCAILTISDTRTEADDASGRAIEERLRASGVAVAARSLCQDEPDLIRASVEGLCARGDVDAVITTGGTGLAPRDQTCEALGPMFQRRLEGFGELFRMLSFQEVGPAAMLSRATAGIIAGKVVFALPGSETAVRLALDKLIVPELRHLVWLLRGTGAGPRAGRAETHHHHHHHHHHHGGHAHGHGPGGGQGHGGGGGHGQGGDEGGGGLH